MFDISSMMGKLQEMKQKMEETKTRLNSILIDEKYGNGAVKVTLTANRRVKSIEVSEELLSDKEQLEDYLILALNKAIERADSINEQEMATMAMKNMPNIPGFGS